MSIPSAQKKLSHQQPCSIRIHGFPAGFLTNSIRCLATRPGTKKPFANLKMAEMVDLPMKKKVNFHSFCYVYQRYRAGCSGLEVHSVLTDMMVTWRERPWNGYGIGIQSPPRGEAINFLTFGINGIINAHG